jgi:CheY-like chemotaxis protein
MLVAHVSCAAIARAPLVLVVDDFEDARELYAASLVDAGFEVAEAANGQEALELVAGVRPVVVVMDMAMPVVDGWEATRRLKTNPSTAGIVVIALTGHATGLGFAKAREAGADAVVAKPFLPGDLIALVRSLLPSHADPQVDGGARAPGRAVERSR